MKRTKSLSTTTASALVTLASLWTLPCAAQEAGSAQPDATVSGTGRADYIPIWRNSSTLGDSTLYQSGSNLGIGTKTPQATLEVDGAAQVDGNFLLGGNILSAGGSPIIQVPNNGQGNFSAGLGSLSPSTTGQGNVAVGDSVLPVNTSGFYNTGIGYQALFANTTGFANTATGNGALFQNTIGEFNTANGSGALGENTSGIQNTASGVQALLNNTTGGNNTAIGTVALYSNSTGSNNVAGGFDALYFNNGSNNTGIGDYALYLNTTGSNNTALGYQAGYNIGTTSYNIDIGNAGTATDTGVIRIGNSAFQSSTYIAGIYGATTSTTNAVPVMIDSNGNLGTISSSRRYKEDIHDMGAASSGLLRLRPVTFRYKKPFQDGSRPVEYGLIAEEVAEVYPDLVARSADGQVETVKYQVLDAMLLNELQKQNATIAAQKDQIRSLEERLERVEAALEGRAVTSSH